MGSNRESDLPESVKRALDGSPLRTPEGGKRFVRGMSLLLALVFLGQMLMIFGVWMDSMVQVYITGFILATIFSIPAIAFIRWLDRRERESPWLLAGALLWGSVIGTGISAILNQLGFGVIYVATEFTLPSSQDNQIIAEFLGAAIAAPVVEEFAKGLGVLILLWFLRAEFDNLRDGIIYGALIGLGFLIAEYALYLANITIEFGKTPYLGLLVLRDPLFGLNTHTIWTALFGAGVGLARQTANRLVRVGAPFSFYSLAVFFHSLNNSIGVFVLALILWIANIDLQNPFSSGSIGLLWSSAIVETLIVQFWAYALLVYLLMKSGKEEIEVIRLFLKDEVGRSVTHEEYALIESDHLFHTRRLPIDCENEEKAIINAQNELAFRKWHLSQEGKDPEKDQLVLSWRQDIKRLRIRCSSSKNNTQLFEPR
ncbi:MAG: PrsW family intramembrane metalloprotease [Methanotrichaceae archaeon]|nr:PrsW family intramembrane metalloprotease [Methanotrichaceae archaeon]